MSDNGYFASLKIVDFTGELGPYAARMYAGLGAQVVHVEPMDGDPLRRVGPFFGDRPNPDGSLPFLYYNAGKRGIAVDLAGDKGREVLARLCAGADLFVESCAPGYLEGLGLSFERLAKANPRLVQASITRFGQTGPLSANPGSDLTCAAQSGFLYLAGVDDEKPVRTPDDQLYRMAEAYGSVGAAIALYHARRTGQGQWVDVSCVEAGAMALENAAQFWDLEGKIRRGRGREAGTATIHRCVDGYIALVAIMGKNKSMWDPFVEWMKQEGVEDWQVFDDLKWIDPAYRSSAEGYTTFCRIFEKYTAKHTKIYLYETGQRFKTSVTPVSNGKDLLENPQLRHRGFWQKLASEALGAEVTYPGAPYQFSELQWRLGGTAPRLGQHSAEICAELGYSPAEIEALAKAGAIHVG